MDREPCLDFQRIPVTEDESLDTYNNIMTKLHLDRRLPEGRRAYERLLEDMGLKPAREDQEDGACKQFVFQGQCLVLGESEVGKTSLVKSLTGKPFDPKQPKTQGIDQSFVNERWQNMKLKDLTFGNFSRFFKNVFVQLTVFGKAGNVIVQESTNLGNNPQWGLWIPLLFTSVLISLLLCCLVKDPTQPLGVIILVGVLSTLPIALWCIFHSETIRLVAIAWSFFVNYRGLLMGAFISVLSEAYLFRGMSAYSFSKYLLFSAPLGFPFFFYLYKKSRLFQQSFAIIRKCRYPGQLKFKNQRPVEIIFIGRFVITVIIGFTFTCFTILMTHNPKRTKLTSYLTSVVVIFCHLLLLVKSVPRIVTSLPGWRYKVIFICLCCVGVFLPLDVKSVITFLAFSCDAVHKEYFCIASAVATIGNDHQESTNFTAVCMEKAAVDQRSLTDALNKEFSSFKLKILDFAGDKEYHAYHHMFLRSRAIYFVVFNMAEFAENSFRDIQPKIKTIHLWFESICSHVPLKTPILLVGTHRGNMNQIFMEEINDYLKSNLWHLYCDEIIENDVDKLIFFPVENSEGQNDPGVQTLREKIRTVAEERKETIGRVIPLSWIQIQDEIISLRENKKAKFCVTLEEFPTALGTFICTNWSKETLKYFHEKGLVIYLDKDPELSKWVLLKPEVLVDIIIQLVMPPPQMIQERGFRGDWKLLQNKGKLTKSLLTRIISTAEQETVALTRFLEEYDLICPLSNRRVEMCNQDNDQNQSTHFAPSLLPMSADGCMPPIWQDDNTDKKFYVFFKRFLPEPLFHRLLSRAHKNSMLEYPNGQTVLYRDAGMFWMRPSQDYKQPYRLRILKEEGMIEVTISSRYCCKQVSDIKSSKNFEQEGRPKCRVVNRAI